jgi:deoxyribose-phosphate aldolase
MQWSEAVDQQMTALAQVEITPAIAERLLRLLDLTSLNETDTQEKIAVFLEMARTLPQPVAGVCVWPQFVRMAANEFAHSRTHVVTVANFPEGAATLVETLTEIERALTGGANEIDVVFPYQRFLAGERHYALNFIEACKAACGEKVLLKVILETGVLVEPTLIADASYDALMSGADFIKTSTGKISDGASLEAVATMLLLIKHTATQLTHPIGIKISGGIRTSQQAAQYLALADQIMGANWATPRTFRIGASQLAQELLKAL